jgi:hypothetical protein
VCPVAEESIAGISTRGAVNHVKSELGRLNNSSLFDPAQIEFEQGRGNRVLTVDFKWVGRRMGILIRGPYERVDTCLDCPRDQVGR